MRVEVKRRRWVRGDSRDSALRNDQGKQCCLGFVARSLGYKVKDILHVGSPESISQSIPPPNQIKGLTVKLEKSGLLNSLGYNSKTCRSLMHTNDTDNLTPSAREAKIKALGKRIGIEFRFKD